MMRRIDSLCAAIMAAAVCIGCLAVSGCHAGVGQETSPSPSVTASARVQAAFTHTDAGVVLSGDQAFPANFVFVAEKTDPIWRDFAGITINAAPGLRVEDAALNPGDAVGDLRMGSITATLTAKPGDVGFTEIEIQWAVSSGRRNASLMEVRVGMWAEGDVGGACGCSAAVGGGPGVAAADALTGTAGAVAGRSAWILAVDCDGRDDG